MLQNTDIVRTVWLKRAESLKVPRSSTPEAQKFLEAVRPERAEAPSPGHRPGYNSNQQDAL